VTVAPLPRPQREEPEVLVWATVLLGLLAGFLFLRSASDRTTTLSTKSGAALTIPLNWGSDAPSGALLGARDLQAGSFGPRVSLGAVNVQRTPKETLAATVSAWSLTRGEQREGYRVLGIQPVTIRVNGKSQPAMNLTFAYLQDAPGSNLPPAVMLQTDTITEWKGKLYAVSFTAERGDYQKLDSLRARLTADVRLP